MTLEQLKEEVNTAFDLDICDTTRKRKKVYAKKVFCKLGRELGYTYQAIADVFNSNHDLAYFHCETINSIERKDKLIYNKIISDNKLDIDLIYVKAIPEILKKKADNYNVELLQEATKIMMDWNTKPLKDFLEKYIKHYDKRIKVIEENKVVGAELIRKHKNPFLSY
jgi:hypothetical protein